MLFNVIYLREIVAVKVLKDNSYAVSECLKITATQSPYPAPHSYDIFLLLTTIIFTNVTVVAGSLPLLKS